MLKGACGNCDVVGWQHFCWGNERYVDSRMTSWMCEKINWSARWLSVVAEPLKHLQSDAGRFTKLNYVK